MNEDSLYLDLDFIEILESDEDICVVEMLLLHTGENRNKCNISKEAVIRSLPTFFNKPIIYKLNLMGNDFLEHNRSGFDNSMYICGIIPSGSPTEFIQKDGREYLKVKGVIYSLYQPKVWNIFKNRDGNLKVSIEILPIESYKDNGGILHIDEFKFLGVTLLGEKITEGIEGSSLNVLKYSIEDFNQKFETFSKKYKIPEKVKESAEHGLKLRKEYGRGGTSVGINMAKYLCENEYIALEKIKKIREYFPRHSKDNLDQKNPPSNGWIAHCLRADSQILLSDGTVKSIKEICENKLNCEVLSYNQQAKKIESKKITNWFVNQSSQDEFVQIGKNKQNRRGISNSTHLFSTKEHPFYTENGWVRAENMQNQSFNYIDYVPNKKMKSILYGTCLGDSSITDDGRLRFSHCIKQKEYGLEISSLLNQLGINHSYHVDKSGYGVGKESIRFSSNVFSFLLELRKNMYIHGNDNKKYISKEFLKEVDDIALAFWIQDDGSLHIDNRESNSKAFYYRLHIEGFDEDSSQNIKEYFEDIGIRCSLIKRTNTNGYSLYISREGSNILALKIAKYIHPSMRFKLPEHLRNVDYELNKDEIKLEYNIFPQKVQVFKEVTDITSRSIRKPKMCALKYDITVEDNHNFFANGILVHNCLWGGDDGMDWSNKIMNEEEDKMKNSLDFAKDDFGTKEALKVDKSKDAVSESSWGEVDKTALRNKIMEAKNYKSLVDDVYLVVEDGWEDAPSEKLKYPVMEIKGDELVYNRHGISSALGYAKKEDEKEAIRKAESLYKKLDIDDKEEYSMDMKKIENKLDKDNKELEKIRDDADSMEDDTKEELKKNAVVDAPENDKLRDDVDADRDYWKKRYAEMEMKCHALEEEVKTYARKDEVAQMEKMIEEYSKAFSKEDKEEMEKNIEKCSFAEMKDKVCEAVMKHAKKMSDDVEDDEDDDDDDEKEIKNSFKFSYGLPVEMKSFSLSKDGKNKDIFSIASKYGKK